MSPTTKLYTGSLNVAVTLIVLFVGFGAADVRVTVGATVSYVTVWSVLVEAVLPLVAASWATPAPIEAMTVPFEVMPLTATLYVVPERLTSPVAKSATDSLNTTVKLIGLALVGSACVAAWLMVTVGGVASYV